MKNTFGQQLSVTLFGESHGPEIGAVLDGIAPGIPVDEDFIRRRLSLRRPAGDGLSTARAESDPFRIVSGVFEGKTTGTPLCLLIPNGDTHSRDYNRGMARPGHADYTAECKYHGFQDYRGGGHFSGRLTAPLVAVGAILLSALAKKGITIGTHIASLAGISDRPLAADPTADLNTLNETQFPVLDGAAAERMKDAIRSAAADGDSVGGILETAVVGMPAGVGEPWFDTVEGMLSHALFGIPAVKGVEFGAGFGFATMRGFEANDGMRASNGCVVHTTNHNGGICGGITNGAPLLFRCVVKPTPSIAREQESIDLEARENVQLAIRGRHDPAIVHRARAVVDSVTALVLADLLTGRFGTDFLAE
ncbi:MAG TPA: chorismate synthase [Clostridiales bacterium]|nr:chorismate synthase [Clostridiales bacterium]